MNYSQARKSVIWLLRFESMVLALLFLYLTFGALTSTVTVWSALIAEMFFAVLGSVGLYLASSAYVKEKSYGRSPAVLANLIALGVAYFMISGKFFLVGIPLALLAIVTIYSAIKGFKLE